MSEADCDIVILLRNPVLAHALLALVREAGAPHAGGDGEGGTGTAAPLEALWSRAWRPEDIAILDPSDLGDAPDAPMRATAALGTVPRLCGYASAPSVTQARACMRAAFRGYVPMSAEPAQVARALAVIGNGGIYLDRRYSGALTGGDAPAGEMRPGRLSERELAVLKRVAMGMSQKQIAAELEISHKTVDTYRARGMRKLDLVNRAHLVRFALDHAWLD